MSPVAENVHGYADGVWRRFLHAAHAGVFPAPELGVLSAQAGTPAARSVLALQLRLQGDHVAEARFRAYGCPTTIAVGEWLAEQAERKTITEFGTISAGQIRLALEIPDDRAHCTLLGEDVIQALLRQFQR